MGDEEDKEKRKEKEGPVFMSLKRIGEEPFFFARVCFDVTIICH